MSEFMSFDIGLEVDVGTTIVITVRRYGVIQNYRRPVAGAGVMFDTRENLAKALEHLAEDLIKDNGRLLTGKPDKHSTSGDWSVTEVRRG